MTEETKQQVTLTIDGVSVTVPKGTTVYHAAKKIQVDIPVFCYQDRMPPFGACRMCLVEVEKSPKLQTSCTLEATDGMVVTTQSQKAVKGREDIIEFLLINHPLDCPICDRGGECPLQENAFNHGPGISRFFEEKRHFKKALPLGPVLMLDRERCIICARCTRFSDLVSGDHALEFKERGFKSEVGTPDNQPIDSKFIGNTISICPVGALTSQVYRFRARPWDNDQSPSSCTLCPVGCSMAFDSRDGEIMRTRALENKALNDIWMCDKGFFGYEFVTSSDRLQKPLIRKNGQLEESSWNEAIGLIASKLNDFKADGKIAGWGGNPLTTEENYLFQKIIRTVSAANHLDHRIDQYTPTLAEEGLEARMSISLQDVESLNSAYLLGLDVTEEFPVLWLRLKQGMNHGAKFDFIGHFAPEIASHLHKTTIHAPGQELDLLDAELQEFEKTLTPDKKSALFVGRQYLHSPNRLSILSKLNDFSKKHPQVSLNIMEGSGNSLGARFAGMHPELGPMHAKLSNPGLNSYQLFKEGLKTGWDYLHVAGNDPKSAFAEEDWKKFRANLKFLVVQDLFLTETAKDADIVLPTLCYVEKGGSFVNIEGRVQTLLPGKMIPDELMSDAEIFIDIANKLNLHLEVDDPFKAALENPFIPSYPHNQIQANAKVSITKEKNQWLVSFSKSLFDDGERMRRNKQLRELKKQPTARIHPEDGKISNFSNKETVVIIANQKRVTIAIEFDKNVAQGTVVLPIGFKDFKEQDLFSNQINGQAVEIKRFT